MQIIHKYLTKEIFKHFVFVLLVVIGIYVIVDFFGKADDFIEAGLPVSSSFIFLLLKLPFIIAQIIPVCILLAVLVTFGMMNKNNEIIALKSNGISVYYLFRPVFSIGLLLSVLLFLFSEIAVPVTMTKSNRIWIRDVKKKSAVASKERNIWIKGNRSITYVRYYNPTDKSIIRISINYFDKDFRLIKRLDAKKGFFRDGKWFLYEVIEQNKDKKDNQVTFHEELAEKLDFMPDDLKLVAKKPEEMSFNELLEYINKVEAEGYDATGYKIDLYAKMAFPFSCIIMCIVGTGIAVKRKKKDGLSVGIGYGIGIAFLYWVFYSFCLSIGYGEVLPPVIAAWTANLVFLCFGVITLINAE
ncbi:MAG TPA: LPS export ABC transporter permease LptG [Desulfobacterales bacterium]|nr:LPS export ABC transporter permease LptG [Desulfobacterales bacterium]